CVNARGSVVADRHDRHLDAAVFGAAGLGVVAGDRVTFAGAGDDQALAADAAADQVVGHGLGAVARQLVVVGVAADAVGMAGDLDHRLVVLAQGIGHAVEHAVGTLVERAGVEAEGDRLGHVQGDVVAVADHVHAGALHAFAQRAFLVVLVAADGAAGQAADTRANERMLA